MIVIKDWSLVAPEYEENEQDETLPCLYGMVFGHPIIEDGAYMVSMPISKVNGTTVTTSTGNIYKLYGEPHDQYLDWIKECGFPYDPKEPIKIVKVNRN